MKGVVFFVGVFLLAGVFASPSLNVYDDKVQPGESVLISVDGGDLIKDISKENVVFYVGRKEVYPEFELARFNKTYFLCVYPTKEENLSLRIERVLYEENGSVKEGVLNATLNVLKENLSENNKSGAKILLIKPRCVTNKAESLIENKGDFEIKFDFLGKQIDLKPGEFEKIYFPKKEGLTFYEIQTYKTFKIPMIYTNTSAVVRINNSKNFTGTLSTNFNGISFNLTKGQEKRFSLRLFNKGEVDIWNITIHSPEVLNFSYERNLTAKNTSLVEGNVLSSKTGVYTGHFEITYTQNNSVFSLSFPYSVYIFPKGTNLSNVSFENRKCSDIGGKVCDEDLECSGKHVFTTSAEDCCIGDCVKPAGSNNNSGSNKTLIGLIVLAALAGIGYLLYKRVKSVKKPTPTEKIKEIAERKQLPEKSAER